MIPIIPKIVKNWDSETNGLFMIQGSGNDTIIQIIPNNINNFAFAFLSFMIIRSFRWY